MAKGISQKPNQKTQSRNNFKKSVKPKYVNQNMKLYKSIFSRKGKNELRKKQNST